MTPLQQIYTVTLEFPQTWRRRTATQWRVYPDVGVNGRNGTLKRRSWSNAKIRAQTVAVPPHAEPWLATSAAAIAAAAASAEQLWSDAAVAIGRELYNRDESAAALAPGGAITATCRPMLHETMTRCPTTSDVFVQSRMELVIPRPSNVPDGAPVVTSLSQTLPVLALSFPNDGAYVLLPEGLPHCTGIAAGSDSASDSFRASLIGTLGAYREYEAPVPIQKRIAVGRLCGDVLAKLADSALALLHANQTTHIK